MAEPVLRVRDLHAGYGQLAVLHDVSLHVAEGELVALVGPNGAGKSTLMRTIVGLVHAKSGSVTYASREITNASPHRIARQGLSLVLEERGLFAPLTVSENLRLGRYAGSRGERGADGDGSREYDLVYSLFPVLHDRRGQVAGTLSGGEQKMLAVARALMARPRVLLLDEPCAGLAPILVERLYEAIEQLHEEGLSVLVVEQNVRVALELCQRAYVITNGGIRKEGPADALMNDEEVRSLYLGGA